MKKTISFLIALALLSVLSILFISIFLLNRLFAPDKDFCTVADTEYMIILSNVDSWIDMINSHTLSDTVDGRLIIPFTAEDNKEYTVYAERDLLIFFPIHLNWPLTIEGSRGYLYIPTGKQLSGVWISSKYNIQQLDHNIFCYTEVELYVTRTVK